MKNNITAEEVLERIYSEGPWVIDPFKLSQLLADILNKLDEKKD